MLSGLRKKVHQESVVVEASHDLDEPCDLCVTAADSRCHSSDLALCIGAAVFDGLIGLAVRESFLNCRISEVNDAEASSHLR